MAGRAFTMRHIPAVYLRCACGGTPVALAAGSGLLRAAGRLAVAALPVLVRGQRSRAPGAAESETRRQADLRSRAAGFGCGHRTCPLADAALL